MGRDDGSEEAVSPYLVAFTVLPRNAQNRIVPVVFLVTSLYCNDRGARSSVDDLAQEIVDKFFTTLMSCSVVQHGSTNGTL